MAITWMTGWETGAIREMDGFSASGGTAPVTSTLQARTGTQSLRCQKASGNSSTIGGTPPITHNYLHFGVYFVALPTVNLPILNLNGAILWLTPTGNLRTATGGADSVTVLSAGVWYWIGLRGVTGTSVVLYQVNGVNQETGNLTAGASNLDIGPTGTQATALDIYFDDFVADDTGFIAATKVSLLVPISDNARGANWFKADGTTTTNLFQSVDNVPPAGVPSASEATTPLASIRHTGGANNSYDANLSTYTAAGIAATDTIVAVQSFIRHGPDIATGTKLLAVGLTSNPAESLSGSFTLSSSAHGTEPTSVGWTMGRHTPTLSPSVTLGTSPVLRVNRPETASRVACVDFMGLYVAWRQSVAVTYVPRHGFVNHQNPGVL